MAAHTTGSCLLFLEPAMGFGPARLVLAPAGVASRTSANSLRCHALVVGALPTGARTTGFVVAPATAGAGGLRLLDSTTVAAVAGSSSTTGRSRRGVVAIGAARRDFFPTDDDDPAEPTDDDANVPAELSDDDARSMRHIAAWVELAQLQTTFEVAFDAGVLKSGRDLRRVLDAIGEIDLTAPSRPWSKELCLHRIGDVIGEDMLKKLLEARTPEDDKPFGWSSLAAESMIEGVLDLMAILRGLPQKAPGMPICGCCPMILKQLLKVVCEFTSIIESTKFRRPQESLRYRLLEAHALALEHVCVIALDVYQEAFQELPEEKWTQLREQLMNRRIMLFEQDMGVIEYVISIGVSDTERVFELVEKVTMEVRKKRESFRNKER